MKNQLQERIKNLKTEYESGQKKIAELELQASELRQNLLRISGAIQVLEEVLSTVEETDAESRKN